MLMGAASADVPAIMVTGGPMLRGQWRREELGSGTDAWRLWAERRAGRMSDEELCEAESCMSRSAGHCMVMGTASTMASMAEALGMTLPGNAAIPAPDSRRLALAELSGRRAVEMALAGGPKPSQIMTARAFDNAIRADMAIGGSTNAMIHLVAIAGRLGVRCRSRASTSCPRPRRSWSTCGPRASTSWRTSSTRAGSRRCCGRCCRCSTGTRRPSTAATIGENVSEAPCWNEDVIRPLTMPLAAEGGTVVLTGNLCPDGAVLKQSAASPHLLTHRGRAVVFEDHDDLHRRIDDPALPVDERSCSSSSTSGPRAPPACRSGAPRPFPPGSSGRA